jgi:osmotically-inducible protein OsmY
MLDAAMQDRSDNVSNLELLAKVRAALRSEPRLGPSFHAAELRIEPDGVLVLAGQVPSVAAKKLALERVAALGGISGIVDRLHVEPAARMTDKEIRVHLRDMLIEELSFKHLEIREAEADGFRLMRGAPTGTRGNIDTQVQDGVVTLNGSVPGLTSKRLAGVMAWWVPGVRDVVNGIAVDPPEDDGPDMIAKAVRAVLEKDPFVNASQVRVGVQGTTVRLFGLVPSEIDKDAAERDAWCIFAVDKVINEIEVRP